MFIRFILPLLIITSAILHPQNIPALKINEFMASNASTISDPDFGEFGDWIEIYNAGAYPVELNGLFVTDNRTLPFKFQIDTAVTVQPGNRVLIWADDHNTGLHANFKLSGSGEFIGIYDSSGNVIDTFTFGAQQTDISMGRFPEGEGEFYFFNPASPGTANLQSSIFSHSAAPVPNRAAGFYPAGFLLAMTTSTEGGVVHFTTDGREPDVNSPVFPDSLLIDSTVVIKAITLKPGFLPSEVITGTYLISENHVLPVISISTNPDLLFSDTAGIYVAGTNGIPGNCVDEPRNWNQDWEIPVTFQFFETDKTEAFTVRSGMKIYGGCTRKYAMKSLAIYMRSGYGYSKLNYRIFPRNPVNEFNNLIFRSSGQDWWRTMFRDAMIQQLLRGKMVISTQDYRPAILYLNGEYWGIHNIREKYNEHYLSTYYPIDEDNIDLIEISKAGSANNGDTIAYSEMISFLTNNDMTLPANYDYIKTIVDIDNYIDYICAEIYSANADWPGSNMKLWRERKPGAKWRWLIYDTDFGFGGNSNSLPTSNTLALATATNGPAWPNPPWSTLMLRKLLTNEEFRNEFIQRFAVHINTTFEKNRVLNLIDSIKTVIAPEIPRHKARWPQSISYGSSWDTLVYVMKDFAVKRAGYARSHFYSKFGISGSYSLKLKTATPAAGRIIAHGKEMDWETSPVFFKGIPVKLRALPNPGYRFVKWEGASGSQSEKLELILSANDSLTAVFEPDNYTASEVIINEINYKSSPVFDAGDWVEIMNTTKSPIPLAGWSIKDGGNTPYMFDSGAVLPALGYLVIAEDTARFRTYYPGVSNFCGPTGFGLSSSGEAITVKDSSGAIVNTLQYSSSGQWNPGANGTGYTLSLINPGVDNSRAENWGVSGLLGTPGRLNDVYTRAGEEAALPAEYSLAQNYPNPFNPVTNIVFTLSQSGFTELTVYDVLGSVVAVLKSEIMDQGVHNIQFDASGLNSGVYFYMLRSGNYSAVKKMLLIK
ncbi:MAG: CotH kinase family protein [Ignavibacteriaceae bacterium]|nr:CotH kinase family protein [Ignavibacteriaceae bacterium]